MGGSSPPITCTRLTKLEDLRDRAGTMGPRLISPEISERLNRGEGHTFKMHDDDGELYYTGRIISADMDDESVGCYAPLQDFGAPDAGAVEITYPGHKEWDCG